MVEKIAVKLVKRLKEEKFIHSFNEEYYKYAVVVITERCITAVTILLLGFAYRKITPAICFMCFFFSLRERTGGYHANKFWQCYIGTVITFIAVVEIAELLYEKPIIMYSLLLCSVILIEIIGTVNHPNMDMNRHELKEAKKAARLVVLLETIIIMAFALLGLGDLCVSYMSIAVILCATLMCFAKIIKQEVEMK